MAVEVLKASLWQLSEEAYSVAPSRHRWKLSVKAASALLAQMTCRDCGGPLAPGPRTREPCMQQALALVQLPAHL